MTSQCWFRATENEITLRQNERLKHSLQSKYLQTKSFKIMLLKELNYAIDRWSQLNTPNAGLLFTAREWDLLRIIL